MERIPTDTINKQPEPKKYPKYVKILVPHNEILQKSLDKSKKVKQNVLLQMSHESLADQVHYAIQQVCLDHDLIKL